MLVISSSKTYSNIHVGFCMVFMKMPISTSFPDCFDHDFSGLFTTSKLKSLPFKVRSMGVLVSKCVTPILLMVQRLVVVVYHTSNYIPIYAGRGWIPQPVLVSQNWLDTVAPVIPWLFKLMHCIHSYFVLIYLCYPDPNPVLLIYIYIHIKMNVQNICSMPMWLVDVTVDGLATTSRRKRWVLELGMVPGHCHFNQLNYWNVS